MPWPATGAMQSAKGVTMLPSGQSIQVCVGWSLEARPGAGGRCLCGQCGGLEQAEQSPAQLTSLVECLVLTGQCK